MPKFSIVMIAKNEAKVLGRLMDSLEAFQINGGEVVLLDTGSTDGTPELAKTYGWKVEKVGDMFSLTISQELADQINQRFIVSGESPIIKDGDKYFNFSAARNYVASLANNDMVCFVDCDEVLTTLDFEKIDALIDSGEEQFEYNFVFAHDQYNKPAVEFVQSKFYDRRKAKWTGIVHEVLSGQTKLGFLQNEVFRLEHWQEPHDRHSYLKGLAVDCFNNPTSDRNSHYFARELMWSQRPQSALREFQRHVLMNGWLAERSESFIFMGDIYGGMNNPEKQAESYSVAFYLDSSRREPLMKLAWFFLHNKNYQAAISYAKGALEVPWNGFYASNKAYYEHEPWEVLYTAYGWVGKIPEAQEAITKALTFQPQNPKYLRDIEYYFGSKNPDDYLDKGIEGWMTWKDLKWLHKTAKAVETFVEVGSWAGRSSDAILSGCKGKVWCVDTWKGAKDVFDSTNSMAKERDMLSIFMSNVGHYRNLHTVVKPSVEAAKDFADNSIDCIFIDAGHTYEEVLQDIDAWLPKVKDTGILCGHDYLPDTWMGVVKAVNERFGKPDEVIDWIWVIDLGKRNKEKDLQGTTKLPEVEENKIPKIIHTAWFGGEMPDVVKKSIESQKRCAEKFGYEHNLITLDNYPKNIGYVEEAIKNEKWVKATDFIRANILFWKGGIFLDADQEILPNKNFDDLLHMELFAAKEENGFVGYSLVGSKQYHPLWEEYFDEVYKNFTPLDGKNFESSMEIFSKSIYSGKYKVTVLSSDYFFPYNHQTGIINVTPNTRTFHHFMKTWTDISPDLLPTISIIIPQLGRPEGLKRCLDSIDHLYYPKHLIEVIIEEGEETVPIKVKRAFEKSKGDCIVYAANDIEFTPDSLYNAIRKDKGLVAFNTGEVLLDEGNICEHFLIWRNLVSELENGEIFSTDFHHVGVDNWLWMQAKKLGRAIRAENAIIHHHHFSKEKDVLYDEVYDKGWSKVEEDRKLLKKKLKYS